MSSRSVEVLSSDGKDSPSVASPPSQTGPNGVTEELQSDPAHETAKSPRAGKFRRTALTFFAVRKSICILPSFFGGRNKNQNRWSSKKGISKSRTHDGLSKVSDDDALRSGYISAGDFEYHSQREAVGDLHSGCQGECSHQTPEQKSHGRQRKGLRSLFQSFRHHKSQRNNETSGTNGACSTQCKKEVTVVQGNTNRSATECLECDPAVPEFVEDLCDVSMGLECSREDAKATQSGVEKDSPKSEPQPSDDRHEDANLKVTPPGGYDNSSRRSSEPCLKFLPASETPASSSDQLNLIFGEVSSLKSFDSLTGCGDIIADQEDDSITETTVSGERSRNGGKRASCYLTYQGGGEEMASPEDLDGTGLQDFWGNDASEAVCYSCDPDQTEMTGELTSLQNADALNSSNSTQQAGAMDTSSIADVLTPQSEHQESGPNSDEGYYDSTTPGPDEGQEKTSARLPRDSYSGDALYELFAPDENLISPHYENKSHLPSSKHSDYLSEPVDATDAPFVPEMSHLKISADLYKDFHELPSSFSQDRDIKNKNCNLNSKPQTLVNMNNLKAKVFDDKGTLLTSPDKRKRPVNAECEKRCSGLSFGSTSDQDFETFCEPKEEHLEENTPVALPYKNISSRSVECNSYAEDGQTVCFSQALVDYTKQTQLFCKLRSEGDDAETSAAFTPNMEALPTIVAFDVVDLHNEGEYDDQIHMELDEDVSSPYQEFEESYLQKDAFAECDYQMFDLYEQNLMGNAWAVASLPRHLGLTRVCQATSNPLSLDRRSRSLDTDSLEFKMPETFRENRSAGASEQLSEQNCSPYSRKNAVLSASEVRDSNDVMALIWQTRSESTVADGEMTENIQSLRHAQVKHQQLHYFCSNVSDGLSCDLVSQSPEVHSRQCHLPLTSDSCLPHSAFGMKEEESGDVFCSLHSHNQGSKGRALAGREATPYARSPLNSPSFKEESVLFREARAAGDGPISVTCNNHPEATCNRA